MCPNRMVNGGDSPFKKYNTCMIDLPFVPIFFSIFVPFVVLFFRSCTKQCQQPTYFLEFPLKTADND